MDEYSRKHTAGSFGFAKRGSNLSLRERNPEGRSTQSCNRLGCSTRLSSMKGTETCSLQNAKHPRTSALSVHGNFVGGSSSKPLTGSVESRKPRKQRPNQGTETSSRIEEDKQPSIARKSLAPSIEPSGFRSRKQTSQLVGSKVQDIPSSSSTSSVRRTVAAKTTSRVTKPSSLYLGSGPLRNSLKNTSCSSMSDVFSSGRSSSDDRRARTVASVRKRPSDVGSSTSSGGRISSGSSSSRNRPLERDGSTSVITRRAVEESRMRLAEPRGETIFSEAESPLPLELPCIEFTIPEVSLEPPPILPGSFGGRPSSGSLSSRSRSVTSRLEENIARAYLRDRDGYRRPNMEGIAEVLLALERIEQDDELTYEQLVALETNLILGGFSFHDQHRDMRLDIDNMSYEELLALEEKMGNVSTALSEETLPKYVKRSSYTPAGAGQGDDDAKCSICQEEYHPGDEVGRLACDHRYHVECIYQWLRQKNWCPICKASASPHI